MYSIANSMETMKDLSPRQIQILKAIIEEYIATAEPVGSETLDKKHNLGVSPATIRNEMVRLTDMKLLAQPHTSAGRSPTPAAMKYYVEQLMKPHDMSVSDEVSVKEKMWDYRQEVDKLLREATKTLAERTKTLALTATKEGDLYYAGAANILDMPEFYDYELTHRLFETLDHFDFWWAILEAQGDPFDIVLGEDMGVRGNLTECGFVYLKFVTPHVSGAIGVVGPSRLNYANVVPVVRYVGGLIGEFANSW
jgi:transcriptional regulator of heat shock response